MYIYIYSIYIIYIFSLLFFPPFSQEKNHKENSKRKYIFSQGKIILLVEKLFITCGKIVDIIKSPRLIGATYFFEGIIHKLFIIIFSTTMHLYPHLTQLNIKDGMICPTPLV